MSGNGGFPAYPLPSGRADGLTKREAFAMAAMQGFLASYAGITAEPDTAHIALRSVKFADALLAALDQEG